MDHQTNLQRDEPLSKLPEPLRTLARNVVDAAYVCGAWTEAEPDGYEHVHDELIAASHAFFDELDLQLMLLAKLAAPGPEFSNPLLLFKSQDLRDRILARSRR